MDSIICASASEHRWAGKRRCRDIQQEKHSEVHVLPSLATSVRPLDAQRPHPGGRWQSLPILAMIRFRMLPRPKKLLVMASFIHGQRAAPYCNRAGQWRRYPWGLSPFLKAKPAICSTTSAWIRQPCISFGGARRPMAGQMRRTLAVMALLSAAAIPIATMHCDWGRRAISMRQTASSPQRTSRLMLHLPPCHGVPGYC